MADIILSRVTEKSQSDGTEKLLIEYQDDIYRMPLSEIVNNSGSSESVLIDDTLTLSGYAADAAAAGNRISTVEDLISDGLAYVGDGVNDATTPINADTLCGKDLSYFAQKSDIKPKAGFIYPLATPNVPDGFLLCDGKAYSRTEYVELFAAIGTYYGEGDGSTTFNVPNLQTRVPVGAGNGYELGSIGGEATSEHSHWQTIGYDGDGLYFILGAGNTNSQVFVNERGNVAVKYASGQNTRIDSTFPETINNMQPYTVINYIISTGKDNTVYIRDVINGAQVMPLEVQYGGTGATNADDARKNLGIREYKRNLLDNSDFRNPVNQRGASRYSGNYNYTIDRWLIYGETVTPAFSILNGKISIKGQLLQAIEKIDVNKTYTLAAMTSDGMLCVSGVPTAGVYDGKGNALLWIGTHPADNNCVAVAIYAQDENIPITAEWAALYEGEYTVETLPPYVPKGYASELLECQRYYIPVDYTWLTADHPYGDAVGVTVAIPVQMRTSPTVILNGSCEYFDNSANAWVAITISAIRHNIGGMYKILLTIPALSTYNGTYLVRNIAALSADL